MPTRALAVLGSLAVMFTVLVARPADSQEPPALAGGSTRSAADVPHIGRWKLNPAKSDVGGLTLAYVASPPGTIRSSVNGHPFSTCTVDGREVPIHSGYSGSCRQLDDHTWSSTTKLNGVIISTSQTQLSRDNRTLVVTFTDTQSDGHTSTNRLTYTRISGTTGLVGTWRAKVVSESEPVIEFNLRDDGVTLNVRTTNTRTA